MTIEGASYPISLGGVTYNVSPLSDKDLVELDNWVQQRFLSIAYKSAESASESLKSHIINAALEKVSSITFMSMDGAKLISCVEGVSYMLWKGVVKNHPQTTVEDLQKSLLSPQNIREANRVFELLNVKPLSEVAAKGKAVQQSLRQKKTSTSRSSKRTSSRRRK